MIDEELYKRATEELDSDARKPDVWTRACALASDDHDEARFLYTNLRVEEMLNKDGRQRTFSPKRHRRGTVLSDPDKLELPELETEGAELETEGAELDAGFSQNTASKVPTFALEPEDEPAHDSDDDSKAELVADPKVMPIDADLTQTDLTFTRKQNKTALIAENVPSNDVVSEVPSASKTTTEHQPLSPEQQKTSELTEKLEQQAQSLDVNEQVIANNVPEIRNDYVDSKNRLEQVDAPVQRNTPPAGHGPAFNVLERNGATTAVKRGVSWPALLCTFPWLLSKALIGTAIVYGLLWLVSLVGLYVTGVSWLDAGQQASLATKLWTAAFAAIAIIGLLYIPFRYGNSWVAAKLQKRGYELKASVKATNKRDAVKQALNHS